MKQLPIYRRLHSLDQRGTLPARGFTLIELLIGIVITMLLVIAASYLYLASTESRKIQNDQQMVSENGQFALDIIGRDLINAGFYPTFQRNDITATTVGISTTTFQQIGFYFNPINTPTRTVAAFQAGIFGCDGGRFDSNFAQLDCAAHASSTNTSDALVINYFTMDALGSNVGHRIDCNRGNVASAPENAGRTSPTNLTVTGVSPNAVLFVSNRYTLSSVTYTIEDRVVQTLGLNCTGNQDTTVRPLIVGIEDMQLRYGVFTNAATLAPDQFYRADEMAGLPPVSDSDGTVSLTAWQRVVAVEVCIVARGLMGTKLAEAGGVIGSYNDCNGTSITPTDRDLRRLMRKTFAIRNNLTQTIRP